MLVIPAARAELEAAAIFYAERDPSAARRFMKAVRAKLNSLWRTPGLGDVRAVIVPKFPYRVVYRLAPRVIHVLAFAHMKREPGYWRARRP